MCRPTRLVPASRQARKLVARYNVARAHHVSVAGIPSSGTVSMLPDLGHLQAVEFEVGTMNARAMVRRCRYK